jgi:hypothetical protein
MGRSHSAEFLLLKSNTSIFPCNPLEPIDDSRYRAVL